MNPDDLIKAAPVVAKAAKAVAMPFTSIVKRMLGPAADEVAEMWRDQVRVYRYGRQLKLLEKTERMAREAGFTPQAVPPKILFPLLEGASFEDDENLHDMWAALLANAASPDGAAKVRPGFIATLRQMAPDEAAVLNWIFDRLDQQERRDLKLLDLFADLAFGPDQDTAETRLRVCLGGLESAGLVVTINWHPQTAYTFDFVRPDSSPRFATGFALALPPRGLEFVQACRPPKPTT